MDHESSHSPSGGSCLLVDWDQAVGWGFCHLETWLGKHQLPHSLRGPQILTGSWLKTLVPNQVGFSTGQLTAWQPASLRGNELESRRHTRLKPESFDKLISEVMSPRFSNCWHQVTRASPHWRGGNSHKGKHSRGEGRVGSHLGGYLPQTEDVYMTWVYVSLEADTSPVKPRDGESLSQQLSFCLVTDHEQGPPRCVVPGCLGHRIYKTNLLFQVT